MGWFSRKVPPQTVTQQAVQSPGSRFNANWKFTYERKQLPSPGAQNYAYENLGLAEFSPIGPAVANRMFMRPMQPQAMWAGFTILQAGIGGLVQGTIYGTPLVSNGGPGPNADNNGLYS